MRYKGRTGKYYNLANNPFAQGGEGRLYTVNGEPSLVAKLYKDGKGTYEKERKLTIMVQNPPDSSALDKIAWPTDVLYDSANRFAGFVMPKLAKNEELNVIYEYGSTAKYPNISWRNKIIIAKNLCVVLHAVHSAGHVVGDLNPKNISVNPNNGHIAFFDADSFHITDGGKVFRCEVGMPEYLACEIQKKMKNGATLAKAPLPTFSKASDNFALAIHIFQLLMNGTHPFSCRVLPSQYSVAFPQPVDNIINGDFPFMKPKAGTDIPVFAPPISILPQEIQNLFRRAFLDGHTNPSQRPDAVEWFNALTSLERELKKCTSVSTHEYYKYLTACPWCAADKSYKTGVSNAASYALVQTSFTAGLNPRVTAPARNYGATTYNYSPARSRTYRKTHAYHPVVKTFAILLPALALILGQFLQYFIKIEAGKVLIFDLLSDKPTSMATLVFSSIFAAIGAALTAWNCWQTADDDLVADSWILNATASALYAIFPCFAGYAGIAVMPFITLLYQKHYCEYIPLPPLITAFAFGQIFQYAAFLKTGNVFILSKLVEFAEAQGSFNTLAFLIVTSVLGGVSAGLACYLGHYFVSHRNKTKAYLALMPFGALCMVPSLCAVALLPYTVILACIKNKRVVMKVAPALMAVIFLFVGAQGLVSAFSPDKSFVPVANMTELENNINKEYAAVDVSNIDSSIINQTIAATQCETLKIKGSADRVYSGVSIITSAEKVIFEDFKLGAAKEGESAITFSKDCELTLTGKSFIKGKIAVNAKCAGLSIVNKCDEKFVIENCDFDFAQKGADFKLSLKDVSAKLANGLSYNNGGTLTIACNGDNNSLTSVGGAAVIDVKQLNVTLNGNLTVDAGTSDRANGRIGILSEDITVSGKGKLSVSGGNGADKYANDGSAGYGGGTAVEANNLTCGGSVTVTLKGGDGGAGAQGVTGYTGTPGKKGNNESQGKDPVYGWNGRPGGEGGTGGIGGTGGTGGTALVLQSMPKIENGAKLVLVAGNGGTGGKGGTGGTGGRGGDGGDDDRYSIFWIDDMSGGDGGQGGSGGAGGIGGSGGKSGFTFTLSGAQKTVTDASVTQTPGANGESGDVGNTGSRGARGAHGYGGVGN